MPAPKPNKTQIATALGLTSARVSQLIKRGMPVTSIAAAKKWRDENPVMRAPTNARQAGASKEDQAPKKGAKMQRTGDQLTDLVSATRTVQEQAFELLTEAIANRRISSIPTLIQAHNKAIEACHTSEERHRGEMERRGVLVNKQQIIDRCRRALEAVMRRIKKLPVEQGPQCAGQESIVAVKILEKAVNEVIAIGHAVLVEL